MNDKIRELLQQLYGDQDVEAIAHELQDLITTAQSYILETDVTRDFSAEDIALITYGDSLIDGPRAPLAVLYEFLATYLADSVSIVHILPFHPYSSDDGFSVIDYEAVNTKLGNWTHIHRIAEDFDLMADFVLNHMSAQSNWFKNFLADSAEFADFYLTMAKDTDLRDVTRPRTSPLLSPFTKANGEEIYVWTTFSADQVDFDYRVPNTMLRMMKMLLNYVEHGATVIRLDAIAYLWKEVGTSSIHLPQTHAFIQLMRAVLNEVAPHVWLITETNVPHKENISYFGDGNNEAQLVYNFTLPPLLAYTLMQGNAQVLREWVNTLKPLSDQTTFFNFTASHDGIGVRPLEGIVSAEEVQALADEMARKGGKVSYRENPDGSQSPYEINITYVDAVTSPELNEALQVKQFMVSQSIMLALAGVPAIYIHSLLGSHNATEAVERLGYNRAINRAQLAIDEINTALSNSESFRAQVFNAYRHLLSVRRQSPYFNPLVPQTALNLNNDGVFALMRTLNDDQKLIAIHNISRTPQSVDISHVVQSRSAYDLLTEQTLTNTQIELAPYQIQWLEIQ